MQLGIAVHSSVPSTYAEEKVKRFISSLSCSPRILLGGYWGLMKVVTDEAIAKGLQVVMFLPIERENIEIPGNVVRVYTGCEYRCRSVMLVRSSDVLVALGGGVGTQIEIAMAYAMGKPIAVLVDTGMPTDNLEKIFPNYLDERKVVEIKYFREPEDIAKFVCSNELRPIKTDFG
ncbi:LOG family protein [Stygiolobus caldivivus]|uniref:LOG family protein n=1 Tax=Stygiolobus caldivivus TaxID=2824673 RepID=A0A8D5U6C2_9CREN|nr:LOG family protein [Stygiolobus caldivivus]BCU70346.1 hypothetical protein KN1_16430 [Stygiolobus caldivivus]